MIFVKVWKNDESALTHIDKPTTYDATKKLQVLALFDVIIEFG